MSESEDNKSPCEEEDERKKSLKRASNRRAVKKKQIEKKKSFYLKKDNTEETEESSEFEEDESEVEREDEEDSKVELEDDDVNGIKIVVDDSHRHSIDIGAAADDDDDEVDGNLQRSRHLSGSIIRMNRSKSPTPLRSVYEKKQSRKALVSTVEEEPSSFEIMAPTIRQRSTKALKNVVKQIGKITKDMQGYLPIDQEEYKEPSVRTKIFKNLSDPNSSIVKYPPIMESAPMSPALKQGSKIGNVISSNFLMPGIPKIVGDLWVFIELSITIFQLIFSLINMKISSNKTFNIVYICLASVNTLLACVDGFLYFYELTTCKTFYRLCRGIEEKEEEEEEEGSEKTVLCSCCPRCRVPPKAIKFANQWFELVRTILGELLIYPLVVLDLFDLLGGGSFHPTNQQGRVGFSMFIVGSFYLVLSVYIGRTVMSITTIRSLQGLTSTTSNDSNYTRVVVRFLFHVIGQIFVHLLCVMSVGVKIWQENRSLNGGSFKASPFLWAVIVGGWLIPFLGVVSYFVVNYYWLQSFSLGLFVDMIGLLEEPDFAQAVFEGGGTLKDDAMEKSEKLLEDVKYYDVKDETQERDEVVNPLAKIVYPLKIPIFLLYGILYDGLVGSFVACLLLEFDKNHNVIVIDLTTTTGLATVATIALIVISNLHVIFVINLWMIIIILTLVVLLLGSPVFVVVGVIICYRKCFRKQKDEEQEELLMV